MVKLRAAERPQSLNIAKNGGYVAGGAALPLHSASGGGMPSQLTPGTSAVRLLTDSRGDIVEQSLRAANVLANYTNPPGGLAAPPHAGASLPLACTPTSSIASSVAHPLGSTVDCALDYSQQQRISRSRHVDDIIVNNNNNNNNNMLNCGRHSLSDIVTPTSDVTTASSPSETLSQVTRSTILSLCVL